MVVRYTLKCNFRCKVRYVYISTVLISFNLSLLRSSRLSFTSKWSCTITIKATDATHPQNGMSFGDLGETDMMEIGAGQHGEGGGVRVPMMSAKDTVADVAAVLSRKLDLKAGDKVFVMINGCGATTTMEMLILFKDTVEYLKARGIEVAASMVGEILTVQEAAGFQMNIAKWDDEFIRLWNTPCHTPAYSRV